LKQSNINDDPGISFRRIAMLFSPLLAFFLALLLIPRLPPDWTWSDLGVLWISCVVGIGVSAAVMVIRAWLYDQPLPFPPRWLFGAVLVLGSVITLIGYGFVWLMTRIY
jgi:hypothetical protein